MAEFPTSIFSQRDIENVPGVVYDATKKTHFYVEDLQALAAEITAIETILGENVNGAYDTVLDWLTALAAGGGGASVATMECSGTIDDSTLAFAFASKPTVIFVNGLGMRENHGWTWFAGTATLTNPVGSGGDIFGIK